MDPALRWRQLMDQPDGHLPLDRAAALVAGVRNPDVDPVELVAQLDALGAACGDAGIDGVRSLLFDELGFRGDTDDYHHERNSLLDQVLRRRRGMPIVLSLVVHEVARRVGVATDLVAMPGHVLVLDHGSGDYVDAFHGGRRLDAAGCAELFRRISGSDATLEPAMLAPAPPSLIVVRMLSNLIGRYLSDRDWRNARWALELRAQVPGWPPSGNRDLAAVLARLGRVDEAARVWDEIAAASSGAVAEEAGRQATHLRASLN